MAWNSQGEAEPRLGSKHEGDRGADVTIWTVASADLPRARKTYTCLNAVERVRAAAFGTTLLRRDYRVFHVALRNILAIQLGTAAADVVFAHASCPYCGEGHGKPELSALHDSDVTFSLAHSRGRALIAVTRGTRVGVDIEWAGSEMARLTKDEAELAFSEAEQEALTQVWPPAFGTAALALWVRKEAYAKGMGHGVASFRHFTMSVPPQVARVVKALQEGSEHYWTISDVAVGQGFLAAVAVEGLVERLGVREWP